MALKQARLARLEPRNGFSFAPGRPDRRGGDGRRWSSVIPTSTRIVHLAAQAGVRYSLTNPLSYIDSNVKGQVVLLEAARRLKGLQEPRLRQLVIGLRRQREAALQRRRPRRPPRLALCRHQARRRADHRQLIAGSTACPAPGCGSLPSTARGAGPTWPITCSPTRSSPGGPIKVFNDGRDAARLHLCRRHHRRRSAPPPARRAEPPGEHRLYNLGNHRPETLLDFIATLEQALGRKAHPRNGPDAARRRDLDLCRHRTPPAAIWASTRRPRSPRGWPVSSRGTGNSTRRVRSKRAEIDPALGGKPFALANPYRPVCCPTTWNWS